MIGNTEALDLINAESRVVITSHEESAKVALQSAWSDIVFWLPDDAHGLDCGRFEWLDSDTLGALKRAKSIVLALDMNEAGRRDIGPLAYTLGRGRCKFVQYPDGITSLSQFGLLDTTQARIALDSAKNWATPSVRRAKDLPPRPMRPVHSVGIPGFEHFFKIREGDLSVWSGIPGMGKTTFLNHVMLKITKTLDWSVCFCSFEQDTVTNQVPNMLRWLLGTPDPEMATSERRRAAQGHINERFAFVDAQNDENYERLTLDWVEDCILKAVRQFGCQVFVLDPWNEIEHDKPTGESMHEYIGRALRHLKRVARDLNVHIAIVAHPTKLRQEDGPPGMYNISDSSHWANKPDQVLIVHRPDHDENVEVYVKKCRFQELGKVGKAEFIFTPHDNRYQFKEDTYGSREAIDD